MSTKDKLERFMRDRKKAIDTHTLAAYFMIDRSTVNRCMGELERERKVTRFKLKNGKNYWQTHAAKEQTQVPQVVMRQADTRIPMVGTPSKNFKNYEHVRGYDD